MERKTCCLLLMMIMASIGASGQKRKVIIDQDARGPATTDQQAILMFLQSPEVETLGITVVSGDQWRDEEIAHTLRMLELTGHSNVKVYPGAVFPLINNKEELKRWQMLYGKVVYQGAWNDHAPPPSKESAKTQPWRLIPYHDPFVVPDLPEGNPTLKPEAEDAAHFMIRMVHQYPHQVTIYAGGPLTDLAQAISLDPHFPELAQELVVMGGSIAPAVPMTWAQENRREFNFWFDPEATHIVLRAPWPKVTVTTVDISIKTHMTQAMIDQIAKAGTPTAQYMGKWADEEYMWDELAVAGWLDPSVITKQEKVYLDIDISHTASYGNTLVWTEGNQPGLGERLVNLPDDLDLNKFNQMVMDLLERGPK